MIATTRVAMSATREVPRREERDGRLGRGLERIGGWSVGRLEKSDSSTEERSDNKNNIPHHLSSRNSFGSSLRVLLAHIAHPHI